MAKNSGNKIEGVKGQTMQKTQRNQLLKLDLMLKPALLTGTEIISINLISRGP